jgi:hypothetical protein
MYIVRAEERVVSTDSTCVYLTVGVLDLGNGQISGRYLGDIYLLCLISMSGFGRVFDLLQKRYRHTPPHWFGDTLAVPQHIQSLVRLADGVYSQ